MKKKVFTILLVAIIVTALFPSVSQAALVPCGKSEEAMCTLCDFIVGIKGLVDYGFKIMVVVALAMLIISGVVYVISAGNEGMMTTAKSLLKNVLIGFSIILGAWLIINTAMWVMGTKSDLGIGVESWNKFNCNGK